MAMTLLDFLNLLDKETRGVNIMTTQVEVMSTYWSHQYGGVISAPVTGIGMDENSGNLYIEINKVEVGEKGRIRLEDEA